MTELSVGNSTGNSPTHGATTSGERSGGVDVPHHVEKSRHFLEIECVAADNDVVSDAAGLNAPAAYRPLNCESALDASMADSLASFMSELSRTRRRRRREQQAQETGVDVERQRQQFARALQSLEAMQRENMERMRLAESTSGTASPARPASAQPSTSAERDAERERAAAFFRSLSDGGARPARGNSLERAQTSLELPEPRRPPRRSASPPVIILTVDVRRSMGEADARRLLSVEGGRAASSRQRQAWSASPPSPKPLEETVAAPPRRATPKATAADAKTERTVAPTRTPMLAAARLEGTRAPAAQSATPKKATRENGRASKVTISAEERPAREGTRSMRRKASAGVPPPPERAKAPTNSPALGKTTSAVVHPAANASQLRPNWQYLSWRRKSLSALTHASTAERDGMRPLATDRPTAQRTRIRNGGNVGSVGNLGNVGNVGSLGSTIPTGRVVKSRVYVGETLASKQLVPFCTECGKKHIDGKTKFCGFCGHKREAV